MSKPYDTIVVGAGLAGLTATATLAQMGLHTVLLERNLQVGGRAQTDEENGYRFNRGAHALVRHGLGHKGLQALGVEPAGAIPTLAGSQFFQDGRTTHLPADFKGLIRTKALGRASKLQFAKLMSRLGALDLADFSQTTVDDWLSQYRPDVQGAIKALVRLSTYSTATDVMSADAAIHQLAAAPKGVLYVHDGWASLCGQLADAAIDAGAQMRLRVRVDSIQTTVDGFAVSIDGEQFDTRTVIVAAGGADLAARLLNIEITDFGPIGPSCSAAVLNLALSTMPTNHRFVLGVDQPTYFSVHGPPARLAPKDKVAAVAMRYLSADDNTPSEKVRESLEEIAAAAGATPPASSRYLNRMTVTHGLPIASAGGLQGRPGVGVPNTPGAFVAGDWVGNHGMLADAAINSGVTAANSANRFLSVRA